MSPASESSQLPATALAILGLLSFRPMSGYDLKQFADRSISHFYWSPAKSQVYAELRRLSEAGLVAEQVVEQESRPDKRVYRVNAAGKRRLAEWLNSESHEPTVYKSSLLLRVFLGQDADPQSLIRMIERDIKSEKLKMESLEESATLCQAEGMIFPLLTIRAGMIYSEASIRWSEEALAALRKIQTENSDGAST